MQYRRLGDSGLIVSRMAFGVMTFGHSEGRFASVAKVGQQLGKILALALELPQLAVVFPQELADGQTAADRVG